MKTRFVSLTRAAALTASLLATASLSAQTLNFLTTFPTPTNSDVFSFIGSTIDSNNVNDGGVYADGGANDGFTYVANNRPSMGQTFTTGATAGKVTAIWIRHVRYTDEVPSTFWSFAAGSAETFRITDPSQVNTAGFALDTETYTITGAEPNNPGGFNFSTTGTGLWLRFGLTNTITLAPNTTYGFDVTGIGGDFFETWGTNGDVYSGGAAYIGSTGGATDNTLVPEHGDRAFLVEFNGGTFSPPPIIKPTITNQPANAMVPQYANATFTPGVGGTAPFSYQWYYNTNTLLTGQTNATLTVADVDTTNNTLGVYSVIVTNGGGAATSAVARLSLILPAVVTNVNFSANSGSILDVNGAATPFSVRLAGTGSTIPTDDPNLLMNNGVLQVTSSTYDFNGQLLLAEAEAIGFNLSSIGFNGTQDLSITGDFTNYTASVDYDQTGVFAGSSATASVRAGLIFNDMFANLSSYGVGNQNGGDIGIATGPAPTGEMVANIARGAGVWSANVNGSGVTPNASLAYLNATNDFTVGIFVLDTSGTHNSAILNGFTARLYTGPKLTVVPGGGNLTFTWNVIGAGLESNTDLNNPNGWTAVSGASTSPYVISLPTSGNRFYRIAH